MEADASQGALHEKCTSGHSCAKAGRPIRKSIHTPVTAREVVQTIRQAVGRPAVVIPIPQPLTHLAAVAGDLLAHVVGAPLPLNRRPGGGALVSVSEDQAGGGQCWTRIYARPGGFPQVIHSAKRFAGPTGLEEYLGRGLGMALRVEALPDEIAFVSDHYFLALGRWRVRLPHMVAPGTTRVTHRQVAGRSFLFGLELTHPLAGRLVRQEILFDDVD